MRRPSQGLVLIVAAVSVGALLLMSGCETDKKDLEVGNLSPSCKITGGAAENRPDDYKVEFYWFGYDPDGSVDYFEFAVDDTLGAAAWDTTSTFSRSVLFHADSLSTVPGESGSVSGDFHRWHTFYVRAVDNRDAKSQADHRRFNAFTIAPFTEFLMPDAGRTSQFAQTVRFKWLGQDDDSSRPDRKPVAYRYKLVKVKNVITDWPAGLVQDSLGTLNLDGSSSPRGAGYNYALPDSILNNPEVPDSLKKEWAEVSSDIDQYRFNNLSLGGWAFAIRSVDEAGAVEPDYVRHYTDLPGNVFVFEAIDLVLQPLLRVSESRLGTFVFPTNGNSVEWETPSDQDLRFAWTADANFYGGEIQAFNYGIDIPDPSSEAQAPNGIGGWIGWGRYPGNVSQISFPTADDGITHFLYVKVRDTTGRSTLGVIKLKVVGFVFDKEILIVDDFWDQVNPNDVQHDQYMDYVIGSRFQYADASEITWIYGPDLVPTPVEPPSPPTLAVLSRYKMLIIYHYESLGNPGDFSVLGSLTSADSDNPRHSPKRRILATYSAAGGKIWALGSLLAGGLMGDQYKYPKEPYNISGQETADPSVFGTDSFLYGYMQFKRGVINTSQDSKSTNAFHGAIGSAKARARGYPDVLEIDRTRLPDLARGLAKCEAISGSPLIAAGLDTLYSYQAKTPSSSYNGKPSAFFYHSPTGTQGDIAYFGFVYYFLKREQARAMCDNVFEDFYANP